MYLIMYMLMFAAFIKLRIKEPNTPRPFKVPGGELGMWLVGGVGLISAFAAFLVGFIPPGQIPVGSPTEWVGLLVIGNLLAVGVPLLIYHSRKESWKTAEGSDSFEPFSWQKETDAPAETSKK